MSRSIWENGERRTPEQLKINLKLLIRLMLAYAFYIQDLYNLFFVNAVVSTFSIIIILRVATISIL